MTEDDTPRQPTSPEPTGNPKPLGSPGTNEPVTPTMAAVESCIQRYAAGDMAAKDEALRHAYGRLSRLATQMMRRYNRLKRWEDEADVLQSAMMRLDRALGDVKPTSARAFYGLAALQIRRELIDLSRHHFGPMGGGKNHATDPGHADVPRGARVAGAASREPGPATWAEQRELHDTVNKLPEDLREVFDLLHYNGLSQEEAARLLGVSSRTVKRRWRDARLRLAELLPEA